MQDVVAKIEVDRGGSGYDIYRPGSRVDIRDLQGRGWKILVASVPMD